MSGLRKPQVGDIIEWHANCPACGSVAFKVEDPKGPHGNHLRCNGCGRGGLWMRKKSNVMVKILEAES